MKPSRAWVNLFMDLMVRPYPGKKIDAPGAVKRSAQIARPPVSLRTCVLASFAKSRSDDPKPRPSRDRGIVIALYAATVAFAIGAANQILTG